jgi:hypothetical protein
MSRSPTPWQAAGGIAVAYVCRHLGISDATFDMWKKKYD